MSLKRAWAGVTASKKLELLEQFKKLPKMSERKAAEALKVKHGFLLLVIQNEAKILYNWYNFAKLRDVTVNGPIWRQN